MPGRQKLHAEESTFEALFRVLRRFSELSRYQNNLRSLAVEAVEFRRPGLLMLALMQDRAKVDLCELAASVIPTSFPRRSIPVLQLLLDLGFNINEKIASRDGTSGTLIGYSRRVGD